MTAGPFFPAAARDPQPGAATDADLQRIRPLSPPAAGTPIRVGGRVLDTQGRPVRDAALIVWQADADGRYAHPADPRSTGADANFQGWGVAQANGNGEYGFATVMPGPYPIGRSQRAPHLHLRVRAPGKPQLTTQMLFAGEPLNDDDLLFRRLNAAQQRAVLARAKQSSAGDLRAFTFDVVLADA